MTIPTIGASIAMAEIACGLSSSLMNSKLQRNQVLHIKIPSETKFRENHRIRLLSSEVMREYPDIFDIQYATLQE